MTFGEVRKYMSGSRAKVFVIAKVTSDDTICVRVNNGDFLDQIRGWADSDVADECQIADDGDLLFG